MLIGLNQPPSQAEAERLGVRALMLGTETTTRSHDRVLGANEAGIIKTRIGARYPLAHVGEAWANVASDRAEGKTVIDLSA